MLHGASAPAAGTSTLQMDPGASPSHSSPDAPGATNRKRKADTQDNERLSKRLSLLNLEHNGQKLYVPVEGPTSGSASTSAAAAPPPPPTSATPTITVTTPNDNDNASAASADDAPMQVDDTKHKVYIYSIDDELSSDDSDLDDSTGRLVFLPDIEKHLRKHRIPLSAASPSIPRPVPVNPDGELAGMQVVLYQDPESLTVPSDKDGVRKAIVESRARTRERQRRERSGEGETVEMPPRVDPRVVAAAAAASSGGSAAAAGNTATTAQVGPGEEDQAMELD